MKIRSGHPGDAAALLDIYRPVVLETAISFEDTPPGVGQFGERMASCLDRHVWLVAEIEDAPVGYAYATQFRSRPAYRFSVETTIYLDNNCQGRGMGHELYEALFDELAKRQFRQAFAGVTLPNDASIALHKSLGFEYVGTLTDVGYKFDSWHDVSWWQRSV
jgi:L-amino acid N-acyltransferase YncA